MIRIYLITIIINCILFLCTGIFLKLTGKEVVCKPTFRNIIQFLSLIFLPWAMINLLHEAFCE